MKSNNKFNIPKFDKYFNLDNNCIYIGNTFRIRIINNLITGIRIYFYEK